MNKKIIALIIVLIILAIILYIFIIPNLPTTKSNVDVLSDNVRNKILDALK